jgi:hypothetical protein
MIAAVIAADMSGVNQNIISMYAAPTAIKPSSWAVFLAINLISLEVSGCNVNSVKLAVSVCVYNRKHIFADIIEFVSHAVGQTQLVANIATTVAQIVCSEVHTLQDPLDGHSARTCTQRNVLGDLGLIAKHSQGLLGTLALQLDIEIRKWAKVVKASGARAE